MRQQIHCQNSDEETEWGGRERPCPNPRAILYWIPKLTESNEWLYDCGHEQVNRVLILVKCYIVKARLRLGCLLHQDYRHSTKTLKKVYFRLMQESSDKCFPH